LFSRPRFAFEFLSPARSQNRIARGGLGSGERQAVIGTLGLEPSMNLSVVYQPAVSASTSAYRVRDNQGGELDWANAFLDGQHLRQLSPRSLRIYAYDLLDFARWFEPQHRRLALLRGLGPGTGRRATR